MNTNLPTLLFLFLGLTQLSTTTFSQKLENGGLVITGSVEKIGIGYGTKCIPSIVVYLQFRNDGDVPLILFPPRYPILKKLDFITSEAGKSAETLTAGEVFDRSTIPDKYVPIDYRDVFLTEISKAKPPEGYTITIDPGFSHEFRDIFLISNGFDFDDKPGEPCDEKRLPVPKYRSFKIEYHLTVSKNDRAGELLEQLKQRWKPFGKLLLDSDGGITYRSNEILLSDGR